MTNQNAVPSTRDRYSNISDEKGNQVVSDTSTTGMFLIGLDKIPFNLVLIPFSKKIKLKR